MLTSVLNSHTGAIWKALTMSGLDSTSLCVARKAVTDGTIEEAELQQIMTLFRSSLPPDMCDPSSLGRIRSCTLLPIASAASICRSHGRSGASLAWLRAFSMPIPPSWEMQEQVEQDAANGEVDLVLEEQLLDEHGFEAESYTLAEELTQTVSFKDTVSDDVKLRQYALTPGRALREQMAKYIEHRTSVFAARRSGASVVNVTAEHDVSTAMLPTHVLSSALPAAGSHMH